MARLTAGLAIVTAVIAIGQWLVLLPLFAMGSVNEGRLYDALLFLAFVGWPAAAFSAAAAARLTGREPRRAAVLLFVSAIPLVFPLYLPAAVPLTGAALALARARARAALQGGS